MGDPRKQRKKYRTPGHPWQKLRIEEERVILRDYGLKNKTEIWRMHSQLKNYSQQAKHLNALSSQESEKEKMQLLKKLQKIGLLKLNSRLDDVLILTLKDMLERRLQTIVYRKRLAKSIKEARQLIAHKHVAINGKKITSPSYMVKVDEEANISFAENSPLNNPSHAKRGALEKAEKVDEKRVEIKEAIT